MQKGSLNKVNSCWRKECPIYKHWGMWRWNIIIGYFLLSNLYFQWINPRKAYYYF